MKHLFKYINLGKCKLATVSTSKYISFLRCFKPLFSCYTNTLYQLSTTKNRSRFRYHIPSTLVFLSSKIGFDTAGYAILYCWNIILSATWTPKCTGFIVAAMFNYINEDGTSHSKPQNSKIWSCKHARLQWVNLFIVIFILDNCQVIHINFWNLSASENSL